MLFPQRLYPIAELMASLLHNEFLFIMQFQLYLKPNLSCPQLFLLALVFNYLDCTFLIHTFNLFVQIIEWNSSIYFLSLLIVELNVITLMISINKEGFTLPYCHFFLVALFMGFLSLVFVIVLQWFSVLIRDDAPLFLFCLSPCQWRWSLCVFLTLTLRPIEW